jgi:hypothetical protein
VYAVDAKCPSDRGCTWVSFEASGRPKGACLPRVSGSKRNGQVCSSADPCDVDLECVYSSASSGVCRRYCDPSTTTGGGVCQSPTVCQPRVVLDGKNIPRAVGSCFPNTKYLDPCTTDSSCDTGQVCAWGPDTHEPTSLTNLCDWPVGTKAGTSSCTTDSECKSGACLHPAPFGFGASGTTAGWCQQGCTSDSQCPTAGGYPGACAGYPFSWFDATGTSTEQNVNSCIVQCKGELDCRTADTCMPQPNAAGLSWVARCIPGLSTASGKWAGTSCIRDSECWSNFCYKKGAATDGFCWGGCDPANGNLDCEGTTSECPSYGVMQTLPGPDQAWGTADDAYERTYMCWGKSCTRDADCAGQSRDSSKPRVCSADVDPRNQQDIVLSCSPKLGAKKGGETCSSDTDCGSGWCITWTSGTASKKRCFGACGTVGATSSDCATGNSCNELRWTTTTPNKLLKVCVPTFP